jgi:hypothetical protein
MLKIAKKHNTNLAAIQIAPHLLAKLPAWYQLASMSQPNENPASTCLLTTHKVRIVADLLQTSERLRNQLQIIPHITNPYCCCQDCIHNRLKGCQNPHTCMTEALTRIHNTQPCLAPIRFEDPHDNLSLTRRRKAHNRAARANKGTILFDPSITCKDDLSECFRVFTDPNEISRLPAQRFYTQGINA